LRERSGNLRVGGEPVEALKQPVRHPVQRPQRAVTRFAIEDMPGDTVNVRVAEVAHGEGTQFCRRGASRGIHRLVHDKPGQGKDLSLSLPKRPDVTQGPLAGVQPVAAEGLAPGVGVGDGVNYSTWIPSRKHSSPTSAPAPTTMGCG